MRLTEILDPNCVSAPLPAKEKAGAIKALIDLLDKNGKLNDRASALKAVMDREAIRSTGIGKGFAIGSAALTTLALFSAYTASVKLEVINLKEPMVVIGLFIGGTIPFLVASQTMNSVGRAAFLMVEEVRRQFKEITGLIEGKAEEGAKFSDYFDHVEGWQDMPSHRALAIFRGRNEGILTVDLDCGPEDDGVQAEAICAAPASSCKRAALTAGASDLVTNPVSGDESKLVESRS